MDKAGRRLTLTSGLIASGLACLATGLVSSGEYHILFTIFLFLINPTLIVIFFFSSLDPAVYQIICSLVGKFFATVSFDTVFSYTSEMFPTYCRTFTVGICSTLGRVGSILAPIIADMVN